MGEGKARELMRRVNWPLIFVGTYNVPPATGINYSSWALVNVVFNWWIRKKYFAWWCKSFLLFCKPIYSRPLLMSAQH